MKIFLKVDKYKKETQTRFLSDKRPKEFKEYFLSNYYN